METSQVQQRARTTTALQLPLAVDLSGLLADLEHCLGTAWKAHYNKFDYEGGWEAIALRSQDGTSTNLIPMHDRAFFDTPLLGECPHFQQLLDSLHCPKKSVRLLRQAAGGEIKTHRDQGLGYANGEFRIHIPLVTHDRVDFVVAGERLPMQPGSCWYADFSQPHSVHNRGESDRIHLVIDCTRNAWTDAWLEDAGFDMASLVPPPMPESTRQQMILSLRLLATPTADALIAALETESAALESAHLQQKILDFLDEIGISWRYGSVPEDTFLPGLEVMAGEIVIDRDRMLYPGDILHEAGHIAVLPPEKRPQFSGNVKIVLPEHEGDEMAVILWTFAAAKHLELPLRFVIHDAGYKGSAEWLRAQFESRNYIALPLLAWMGLCDKDAFPQMKKWLR